MNRDDVVRITRTHIRYGKRKNSAACPIACALSEQWAGAEGVLVFGADAVAYEPDGGRWYAPLPIEAQRFVTAFDAGGHVKPFEFKIMWTEIEVPAAVTA